MNREDALAKADRIVTEWTGQVKNERGYVHDKWQPVPIEDRTEAVLKLAEFLTDEPTPAVRSSLAPPHQEPDAGWPPS